MGETKVEEVVRAGEFDTELLEAISLISGVYGGAVFIPAAFVGVEVQEVRRDLVRMFDPIHVQVLHLARFSTVPNQGSTLYEGLSFVHQDCQCRIKVGSRERMVPSTPGEGL